MDGCGVSNSVRRVTKQGAGHGDFATSQRQIAAGAVTRLSILEEQEKWERGVQEQVEKQFSGYMWQLLDQRNKEMNP